MEAVLAAAGGRAYTSAPARPRGPAAPRPGRPTPRSRDTTPKYLNTALPFEDRAADEVVQLYFRDVEASVPVPIRHLEGFRRIHLAAGEQRAVAFTLTPRQLACHGDDGKPFVEPGSFEISVGGAQPDDPTSAAVQAMLEVTPA